MRSPDSSKPLPAGRAAVLQCLQERTAELVEETMRRIWTEIPAYAAVHDPAFRADVVEHIHEHHQMVLAVLAGDEPVTPEDLLFVRRHTAGRVGRIPIADYLWAHRLYQGVVWDGLVEAAAGTDDATAVVDLVGPLLDYVNVATTHAAELYIEIEQIELAGGERIRRDLLEDLVAARPVAAGPRQDAARDAGLGPDTPCLVVVAVPRVMPDDEHVLRSAAGAVRRACGTRLTPLTVLRRDEIVVVAPVHGGESSDVVASLQGAYERLGKQDVRLAIGVSTVHPGLAGVGSAHREARGAADCVGDEGGVLALPALSAFDYLSSFRDPTAERLISPAIRRFVEEDIARGGVLTSTLEAYVASDLNVKALSERIYVHTNTAHYRLNRIAELTGRDLRKVSDVLDLLIAIRLAQPLGQRPPVAWA
ncbi:MAG TPA: helix-turn-helix domain-containing protein [Acidimicrobiia bacterium]|jgi:sugar diacid utilization regulator